MWNSKTYSPCAVRLVEGHLHLLKEATWYGKSLHRCCTPVTASRTWALWRCLPETLGFFVLQNLQISQPLFSSSSFFYCGTICLLRCSNCTSCCQGKFCIGSKAFLVRRKWILKTEIWGSCSFSLSLSLFFEFICILYINKHINPKYRVWWIFTCWYSCDHHLNKNVELYLDPGKFPHAYSHKQ